jgi:hypothetical protein
MPIDLIGAVVGWLVSAFGDAGIGLILGSADKRMMRRALQVAIDAVVNKADPPLRAPLRHGLTLCFSEPLAMSLDGATPVGDWLRAAIVAQVSQLDGWANNDTRRLFYQDVPVDPAWLTEQVTDAIIGALHQVVASGSLPELVHGLDITEVLARLDALSLLTRQVADRLTAMEEPADLRNQAVASAALAPQEYLDAFLRLCKVSHRDLAGILPYLAGHVASAVVTVPARYEGQRLIDEGLQFIRQELQVSVVALRHEGDKEWLAGGPVSETRLTDGAQLLVCGPKRRIDKLREQFDTPES